MKVMVDDQIHEFWSGLYPNIQQPNSNKEKISTGLNWIPHRFLLSTTLSDSHYIYRQHGKVQPNHIKDDEKNSL